MQRYLSAVSEALAGSGEEKERERDPDTLSCLGDIRMTLTGTSRLTHAWAEIVADSLTHKHTQTAEGSQVAASVNAPRDRGAAHGP